MSVINLDSRELALAEAHPHLSIVVPVYNEEANLPVLFARLYSTLDTLPCSWECVFVDDGSKDQSVALLRSQYQQRPQHTRVIIFRRNFGQHSAIMAGFEAARGDVVITLDADLQNPPEEIPNLLAAADAGHDYVGTIRLGRQDHWARTFLSRRINMMRDRMTFIRITDQGCMLRAYSRHVIDAVNASHEVNTFIPALAYLYARNPVEIEVKHEARHAGQSKYSFYKLIRLNFDLMTGFTVVPLQLFSMLGMIVSGVSLLLFVYLIIDRILNGPDVQGVFTLFAIVFFLLGLALFGIGLIGEYVGRTYEQVRGRPRYLIAAVLAPGQPAEPERVRALESPVFSAVVFGYSEVGERCLRVLLDHGVQVPLVFTHEDQPGEQHWFGSVAALARSAGVRTVTPTQPAAPEWLEEIRGCGPDYLLAFYYRSMLPPPLLALARWGALNMHGSLLPQYRGRAPVNWAIANGETQTGATLHYMVARPDAGPIVGQETVAIGVNDDALHVSMAVAAAATRVLTAALPAMAAGPPPARPMDLAQGSYFGGRKPQDGRIDPDWPGLRIHAMIRAVAPPFPGAFAEVGGRRVVFESSRLTAEPVRHPGDAPCLYAQDGRLYVDCRDGVRLQIGAVLMNGQSLSGSEFQERFGMEPWRFNFTSEKV